MVEGCRQGQLKSTFASREHWQREGSIQSINGVQNCIDLDWVEQVEQVEQNGKCEGVDTLHTVMAKVNTNRERMQMKAFNAIASTDLF